MTAAVVAGERRTAPRAAGLVVGLALSLLASSFALPGNAQSSAPAPDRFANCRVESGGKIMFDGKCRFTSFDSDGSFALDATDGKSRFYGEILNVSVAIVEPGAAEVRGLTIHGNNSRWGPAKRSSQDRACWVGVDFKICAR